MRGKSAQHMSIIGTKNNWGTPKLLFQDGKKLTGINPRLDVCATKHNKMCANYFGYDHIVKTKRDGLTNAWPKDFFMNPPYDPDYQCNSCGSVNSFDWELTFEPKSKRQETKIAFLTDLADMGTSIKQISDRLKEKNMHFVKKRLACKICKAGNRHRETLHRGVIDWLKKAYSEHISHNVNGLILTFAKTDTKWWHKYVEQKAEVYFLEGRVRFYDEGMVSAYPAPYGSCWIVYRAK